MGECLYGCMVNDCMWFCRKLLLSTEPYGELSTPYHVLRGLKALRTSSSDEDHASVRDCAYYTFH